MSETLERVISVCTDASSKVYNSRGKYAKGTATQQLDYVWEQRKIDMDSMYFI